MQTQTNKQNKEWSRKNYDHNEGNQQKQNYELDTHARVCAVEVNEKIVMKKTAKKKNCTRKEILPHHVLPG